VALHTQNAVNESVVSTGRTVEAIGKDQYNMYHQPLIVECTRSVHDPIKELPTFVSESNTLDQE